MGFRGAPRDRDGVRKYSPSCGAERGWGKIKSCGAGTKTSSFGPAPLPSLLLRSPTPHRPLHHRLSRASCSDKCFAGTTVIDLPRSTQPWKSRTQRSLHAPSCAAQRSNALVTRRPLFILTSLLPRHMLTSSSTSADVTCHIS